MDISYVSIYIFDSIRLYMYTIGLYLVITVRE